MILPIIAACAPPTVHASTVVIPYSPGAWKPDGGDATWDARFARPEIEASAHFIRAPEPGSDRAAWRRAIDAVRQEARHPTAPRPIDITYRGVRAWVRMAEPLGSALDVRPGESLRLVLSARHVSGNPEVCVAFDYHDRETGAWAGWSTVRATARLPKSDSFSRVEIRCDVPAFDSSRTRAKVIVGQDATHDPTPGRWALQSITVEAPGNAPREAAVADALRDLPVPPALTAIYTRKDLAWASRNFACLFLFLYDTEVYDRAGRRYRTPELLARWRTEFGGVDSVVLWQAYPRIGIDPRNQFDHYRDMPGGLPGLRRLVADLHAAGVRSFIAYNPWDTGTRREPVGDADALAGLVRDIGADGIFLDTMVEAPARLRDVVDRARRGVVFEPEGAPSVEQLGVCSASWAQWFGEFPEPGILLLKWLEPRHMQHQIRRWNASHAEEIRSAFLNGSGMLIWENVFGTWNPWSAEDKRNWRALVPILRAFAPELSSDAWDPMIATPRADVTAGRWRSDRCELVFFASDGQPVRPQDLGLQDGAVYDLVARREIGPADALGTAPVLPGKAFGELGAAAVARTASETARLRRLISAAPDVAASSSKHAPAKTSSPPIVRAAVDSAAARAGMVAVPGGEVRMLLRHERRECGCYPDPGSSPERNRAWAWGDPFHEEITHDYRVTVRPFLIDECLVTNAEYDSFLRATGYKPAEPANFLRHWANGRCTDAIRNLPVVYVDLDDCRAYARWAGKRLPTEAEWQLAGQGTDGRKWPWGNAYEARLCSHAESGPTPVRAFPAGRSPFGCYDMAGNVRQWTESERDDGHTRSAIVRGGSWFEAKGSLWYVGGGPQPFDTHTRVLLMHPGLDRSATIGFRCVRDIAP